MTTERRPLLLAIDTALATAVVAIADPSGVLVAEDRWVAGYRHGEDLLERIDRLLRGARRRIDEVVGIVVGTGPGGFTGLRVGLATAKGLAFALDCPLVGVPTAAALIAAARAAGVRRPVALLLPAGPNERVLVLEGDAPGTRSRQERLAGDADAAAALAGLDGATVVAVDLDGRAEAEALERGRRASDRLPSMLVRLGAERLARAGEDDLAALVPEYVTLPRGVERETGAIVLGRA